MVAPVVVSFQVKGVSDVQRAFQTIEQTTAKADKSAQQSAERAMRARVNAGEREASAKERSFERVRRETEKWQREEIRASERNAREQERIQKRSLDERNKLWVRAEKQKLDSIAATAKAEERAVQSLNRQRSQAILQQMKEEERAVQRQQSQRAAFARGILGAAGQGLASGVGRVANTAVGIAGSLLSVGGGFSVADSVQRETALRRQAAVMSASTLLAGPGTQQIGTDQLLSRAKAIGVKQDIDPAEVLEGFDQIKKLTGDLGKAIEVMPDIAKLSTATGGKLSEMSGLAANILAANPNISNDALQSQMRVFTRQGIVGGVEVSDFARYGSRITAGASLFGTDKAHGVTQETNEATMGAIAQMARQYGGASSAAEAAMASQRFATDVASHAGVLKKAGINVSDGHGGLKDAQSILLEMLAKTGGDVTKLKSMGLGDRGVKALTGVAAIAKNAGGGEAGVQAVRNEFAKYTSGTSKADIDAANQRVLGERGVQLNQALEELRIKVGEAVVPELAKLVPVVQRITPLLADAAAKGIPVFVDLIGKAADFAVAHKGLIDNIVAHPIGSIMALEVTKSVVSANIGGVLARLIGGVGGGGGGVPGVGGAGGAAGGGALRTLGGAGVAAAGALAVGAVAAENDISSMGDQGKARAARLAEGARGGGEGLRAAQAAIVDAAERTSVKQLQVGAMAHKAMPVEEIISFFTGKAGPAKELLQKQAEAKAVIENLPELQRAITQAVIDGTAAKGVDPAARNHSLADPQRGGTQ